MSTPEQQVRDILERMGYEDAQSLAAGDVVELANIIAENTRLAQAVTEKTDKVNALWIENQALLKQLGRKDETLLTIGEQKEIMLYIAWVSGGDEPDWYRMSAWLATCGENRKCIADLRAQNALLRAVVKAADEYMQTEPRDLVFGGYFEALQAAIDSGALAGDE